MSDTEWLPVQLTPDELRQRGAQLATKLDEIERKEGDLKDHQVASKRAIDALKLDAKILAQQINEGSERRHVAVVENLDVLRKVVENVRLDTGEVYSTRPARLDELQAPIPFEPRVVPGAADATT